MELDPRRTAVLALHWQVNVVRPEGFFGPMLAEPVAASGVVERARAFHAAARAAGAELVFTRFTVPEGEGELARNTGFMRAVADAQESFRPSAPGAAIVDDVGFEADEDVVSDNQRLSGLAACRLPLQLAEHGIDTLLVTGVATNLTVEQTARHATDLGFHVVVVEDCVAAADPDAHAASLANLRLTTEACLPAAEVLESLGVHSS
jgi:nicotinamidase-related amidase